MPRPVSSKSTFKHKNYTMGRVYIQGNTLYVEMPARKTRAERKVISRSTYLYARDKGKIIRENLDAALELLGLANQLYLSTPIPHTPRWEKQLQGFAEEVEVFMPPPVQDDDAAVTIEYAWDMFEKVRFPTLTEKTISGYASARKRYLPKDDKRIPRYLPTTRKEVEGLARFLEHRRDGEKSAPSTAKVYEERMGAFFKFCIERGYMPANPITFISKIKPPPTDVDPFTEQELLALDACFRDLAGRGAWRCGVKHSQEVYKVVMMRLLIRFMFVTGARIQEALEMRREWFTEKHIMIGRVKGASRGKKPRYVPHGVVPCTEDVSADILYATQEKNGKVFPWTSGDNARHLFTKKIGKHTKEVQLSKGKNFHAIRKSAENYWRDRLGIPEELRTWMIGHTADIARDAYMTPPSLESYLSITSTERPKPTPLYKRLFVDK